jgi:hypothetical protein
VAVLLEALTFDVTDAPAAAAFWGAERLISLGAVRLSDLPDGVDLADPDGNVFGLHQG